MPEFLTPEWVEVAGSLHHLLPPASGAEGTVSLAFAVAPRKEVLLHWTYRDGAVVAGGAGAPESADLALSVSAADARDLLTGAVEPSVAFMRGRLKASGDGGLLLKVLESTLDGRFTLWRDAVSSEGDLSAGRPAG